MARSLADLQVQATTKYETVISLRTGKALGLDVPPTLFARADEGFLLRLLTAAYGALRPFCSVAGTVAVGGKADIGGWGRKRRS